MKTNPNPTSKIFRFCGHSFPGIWQYMLPSDFPHILLPSEKEVTCGDCNMVACGEYRSDCKCCTHFPELPNFMLGMSLRDPVCNQFVLDAIGNGLTLPWGMAIPPSLLWQTVHEYRGDNYGKAATIKCPLLDPQQINCGVYPYRDGICSTFFCKSETGEAGEKLWKNLATFVGQIEAALSSWAMTQAGLDAEQTAKKLDCLAPTVLQVTDPQTRGWSASSRQLLFDKWFNREVDFFVQCANLIWENRHHLYDIACEQPVYVAMDFEKAVHNHIQTDEVQEIDSPQDEFDEDVELDDLYQNFKIAAEKATGNDDERHR